MTDPSVKAIRDLLGWLASGGALTEEDLAELPVDASHRSAVEARIREAAAEIATHRRDGLRGDARTIARATANELAEIVRPERSRPPTRDEVAALIAGVSEPLR